ncbi:MAG TPA: MotA/TolQ/ExbB proton channel family protein [Novimethylophilus sp.]|jgi:biopolymer transport protein ExbB|uniref:MotA/TolQ/ExbB proton channel family protein n=1 Tax=Novimethylophilus sp. TaxID=2137426 RepID=UPI002F4100F9
MFIVKRRAGLWAIFFIALVSAAALFSPSTIAFAADPAGVEAVAAAPVVAAATEKVANPYGLDALWKTGDFVAKGTLMILVVMSMGSWYIIVIKFFEQFKLLRQARAITDDFWNAGVQGGLKLLEAGSAFGFIAESSLKASNHHGGKLAESVDHNTWLVMNIQRSTENVQNRLQDGLAFLATVGSTAPFVGLFGTVWGIYHALTAIGIAGQASIDKVAGPVGEALIMTAIGLAVAVPAVLGYNWLVRRNKLAMEKVRAFGAEIHAVLMGASGKAG